MTADVVDINVLNNIITNNDAGIGIASSAACTIRTNLIAANNAYQQMSPAAPGLLIRGNHRHDDCR